MIDSCVAKDPQIIQWKWELGINHTWLVEAGLEVKKQLNMLYYCAMEFLKHGQNTWLSSSNIEFPLQWNQIDYTKDGELGHEWL
jgi:hypothetical protein